MDKAVFFDKDGTLVHDVPYNIDPGRLRFTPHAMAGLRLLDTHGYRILLATNQPGLGLGRFDARQWDVLVEALTQRIHDACGVRVVSVLHCPHAPAADGSPACGCRKPAPGLLTDAAQRHGLSLRDSWMVGDILDDIEAGRRAGCRTVLLEVGHETVWRRSPWREPHLRCSDVLDAATAIAAAGAA
jgi:D-glycero-D-manno-heptose 1,7-bisphosphate phosphatase